jgi:hypothetical protein
MCERLMVKVTAPFDGDEIDEGVAGDGPATGELPVDVCRADEVIWFDAAELDQLPADQPDAEPTPEQEAKLAEIRRTFGEELVAAWDTPDSITERIADRLGHSAKAFGLLSPGNAVQR